jgi:hypothetical protein
MLILTISPAKLNIITALSNIFLSLMRVRKFFVVIVNLYTCLTGVNPCLVKQIGKGTRGDVAILPTLVINDVQYRGSFNSSFRLLFVWLGLHTYIHTYIQTYTYIYVCACVNASLNWCGIMTRFAFSLGKLERTAVLMALCAAFKETTDPPLCLTAGLSTSSNPYLDAYL